jgi:hypothetical protein
MLLSNKADITARELVKEKITEQSATLNAYQARYARLDSSKKSDWERISKVMKDILDLERTINVLNKSLSKKDIGTYLIKSAYSYMDEETGTTSEDILDCIKDAAI